MQTPNSDTPYSQLGLDLRAEPMVLTMPAVEKGRYYTAEVNDLYTFISGYIGSRVTGNEAGDYMIAGPDWKAKNRRASRRSSPARRSWRLSSIGRSSFALRTSRT